MGLSEKNLVLCVGGGIAAYKAAELSRELGRQAAHVRVVLTRSATRFIGATTFAGLTGKPAVVDLWDPAYPGEVHVELSQWADAVLVAPATANLLARAAQGLADDAALATLSCAKGPVFFAPAMHERMWLHPATQRNVAQLKADGAHFIGPVDGPLASGQRGLGRMAEPIDIAAAVGAELGAGRDLEGTTILISAGPTLEDIDPVRFISNRSSGRMGVALAQAALARGATVVLVCGPIQLAPPAGAEVHRVRSALEMRQAVQQHLERLVDRLPPLEEERGAVPPHPDQRLRGDGDRSYAIDFARARDLIDSQLALGRIGSDIDLTRCR